MKFLDTISIPISSEMISRKTSSPTLSERRASRQLSNALFFASPHLFNLFFPEDPHFPFPSHPQRVRKAFGKSRWVQGLLLLRVSDSRVGKKNFFFCLLMEKNRENRTWRWMMQRRCRRGCWWGPLGGCTFPTERESIS